MKNVAPVSSAAIALLIGSTLLFWFTEAAAFAGVLGGLGAMQVLNRYVPVSPVHWLRAMALEPLALIAVFLARPLQLISSYQRPAGRFKGRPLLLVHGYMNSGSVWFYHKMQLKEQGFGPIYTINLGHPFRSIRTYGERVRRKAEEIAQETGRKDLVLVGHSMGGLVSAYYATRLAPMGTVTDVVTIGSPLGGTPMAKIGLGPNAREMEPGSELSKEILGAMEKTKEIRFYHIATKPDLLVMPPETALPGKDPTRQFVLEDVGHVGMLFSNRVSHQIGAWIGSRFTNPI